MLIKISQKLAVIILITVQISVLSGSAASAIDNINSINISELHRITNHQRSISGFNELRLDNRLCEAAKIKAEHMIENNYWAHISPAGETPWIFINNSNYYFVYAGENLARGYEYPEQVINGWLNSQSHRENLLSNDYKDVGYAVTYGELEGEFTSLVVAMYASESTSATTSPVHDFSINQIDTNETSEKKSINSITEANLANQPSEWFDMLFIDSKNSIFSEFLINKFHDILVGFRHFLEKVHQVAKIIISSLVSVSEISLSRISVSINKF